MQKLKTLEIYTDIRNNKRVILKSISNYKGTKELAYKLTYGYGADEKTIVEVIPYSEVEEYEKNFEPKIKLKFIKQTIIEKTKNMEESKNNFETMRDILFDTMMKIKTKQIEPSQANAIAKLSESVINSVKIELEVRKHINDKNQFMIK